MILLIFDLATAIYQTCMSPIQISLSDVDEHLRSLQPDAEDTTQAEEVAVAAAAAAAAAEAEEDEQGVKKDYFARFLNDNVGKEENEQSVALSNTSEVPKCTRCRMKRFNESTKLLLKYNTCLNCRNKRKVKHRKPRVPSKLPNLSNNWEKFQERVATNTSVDLFQHNYSNYADETLFPRFNPEELTDSIVDLISRRVINHYITPLQVLTGFRFAVRDHHKPRLDKPNRAKKITWMFVCSQDKLRQRQSRSENKRQVSNKLKTEECESKISLNYDLVTGVVQLSYNHKHHYPYSWKKGDAKRESDVAQEVLNELMAQDEHLDSHMLMGDKLDSKLISPKLTDDPKLIGKRYT